MDRKRNTEGKFVKKSDERREVRSLRLTGTVWEALGKAAEERCITRADLIEYLVESKIIDQVLCEAERQESGKADFDKGCSRENRG